MKRRKPTTGNQKDLFVCVAYSFIYELWKFKNKPRKNFKRQNQQLVYSKGTYLRKLTKMLKFLQISCDQNTLVSQRAIINMVNGFEP